MRGWLLLMLLVATPAMAQEGPVQAAFRREGDAIKEKCKSVRSISDCVVTFATNQPLHVAAGSVAPQNGFGFGAALVAQKATPTHWRLSWNADGAVTPSRAWRAGLYMKAVFVRIGDLSFAPVTPGASNSVTAGLEHMRLLTYVQSISLPKVSFFGIGPDSLRSDKSVYGLREHIAGVNVVTPLNGSPVTQHLHLTLLGEINGRFVDVRSGPAGATPSVEQVYTEATAPGLAAQPSFAQFGEGVRIRPQIASHLLLNYRVDYQQFLGTSLYSFRRWTIDLNHEIGITHTRTAKAGETGAGPLYTPPIGRTARDANGPDECGAPADRPGCPASVNRGGSINLRLFMSRSTVSSAASVPFYFQRTIGGADLGGEKVLASYEDYRFRGPHVLLLEQSFEHVIKGPVGLWIAAQEGEAVAQQSSFTSGHLRKSFLIGTTLRLGNAPLMTLSWATGGPEGHHVAFLMNTSLLGGSTRPSLY